MDLSKRRLIAAAGGLVAVGATRGARALVSLPSRGGTVIVGAAAEPMQLNGGLTTAGTTLQVSVKVFDGLLSYDLNSLPQPQLATAWQVSEDGLRITLRLRPGVRWHDGQPFSSEDVAYSVLEVWKKYHSRGRSTFANVEAVETPDPLTAVLLLTKPAPYILSALASTESQPVPKHLYEGTDPLSNPRNIAPIGTGPFRFVSWQRGSHVVLERNPDYWDQPRPYLDRLIIRFLSDSSTMAAALETEAIQVGSSMAYTDITRLAGAPHLSIVSLNTPFTAGISSFEFNLDRPLFRDIRVRQAFAHSIDREFLVKNILLGFGSVADSPIPASMGAFHAAALPVYEFDLRKAEALLEQAGFKRGADGDRLKLHIDPYPSAFAQGTAQVMRSNLAQIGVRLTMRNTDAGEFVNRVYTRRDFDTIVYGATAGPDPAIGVQRIYWSKDFAPGVAFSNGAHYANPEVDRLLEAAQTELDPGRRRAFYARFQEIVQGDAVTLPLVTTGLPVVVNRKLHDAFVTADSSNFSRAWLSAG
jgi:peptide/nickel transport system substrate-binding protein